MNFVFFLLLSLFLTGCFRNQSKELSNSEVLAGFAAPTTDEPIYKETFGLFQQALSECPQKIWPTANWDAFHVMLVKKDRSAMMWHVKNNSFESIDQQTIPPEFFEMPFNFTQWHDDTLLVLSPDASPEHFGDAISLLGIGIHESFHTHVQNKEWAQHPQHQRGTVYPAAYKPRLYRHMLFTHLRNYFMSSGKSEGELELAAHWFNKWKAEYPQEFLNATDRNEGTARYVEWLARAVAERGCSATDEALLEATQATSIEWNMGSYTSPAVFKLDNEGYDIGGVASLILGLIKKDKTWFAKMKTASPVEVLLANVTPKSEQADPEAEAAYRASESQINVQTATLLGTSIEKYTDKNFVRVALEGDFASFGALGFFLPSALQNVTAIPLGRDLNIKGSDWKLAARTSTVLFMPASSPCPDISFAALVPRAALAQADTSLKKISFTKNGLRGSITGLKTVDRDGYTWFCPRL